MREMKDSGIEWAGQIPAEWKVEKNKRLFFEVNSKCLATDSYTLLSVSEYYGVAPRAEKIKDGDFETRAESLDGYKICHKNDIVMNIMLAWKRATARTSYDGIVSPAYCVYRGKEIETRYYHYVFRTEGCADYFKRHSTGIIDSRLRLYPESFFNLNSPVPPIIEQKQIADFLDNRCSQIDAISADIQKEIETLEQYKRSIITEAVTKGLNPDVEMKDSGIEWVGNIPAHWDARPLYYYFAERKKKNYLGQEQNLLSLSYGKIIRKDINTSEGLLPDSFNGYNIIEPGDIVLRLTDLQNDKHSLRTGLVKEHGIITSAYVTLKAAKEVVPEYFHYLLHAYDVMKVLYNMGNGVRQGLNYSALSKMHIVAPPLDEQKNIAARLDCVCKGIESIIASKKQQLAVIDSYKKSLIYEYVTGKKEVV